MCKRSGLAARDTVAQSPEPTMNLFLYLLTVLIWGTTW
ncbi:MAG TPA: EamA family transporter, partial [Pseudomonas sp.]|nr:EamA family transporter [Pseudomonas sp.]